MILELKIVDFSKTEMPSYQISLTQLSQLEHAIRNHKILGIGMLSHFINIYIDDNWRDENVCIQSMYNPEDRYCEFNFTKRKAWIQNEKTVETITW